MLHYWVIIIVLGLASLQIQAQIPSAQSAEDSSQLTEPPVKNLQDLQPRFLALEKSGYRKRLRFYIGDEFHFKLKGERLIQRGTITDIQAQGIFINGLEVRLTEIVAVILHKDHPLLAQARTYLPLAGVGYFLLDAINPVIVGRESLKIRTGATLIGSGLTLGGLLLHLLKKRTIKLNKRKYLKTILDH
jgi:hypothetical protein